MYAICPKHKIQYFDFCPLCNKMKTDEKGRVLCIGCNKPIHIDKLGGINKNGIIHNNIVCLQRAKKLGLIELQELEAKKE